MIKKLFDKKLSPWDPNFLILEKSKIVENRSHFWNLSRIVHTSEILHFLTFFNFCPGPSLTFLECPGPSGTHQNHPKPSKTCPTGPSKIQTLSKKRLRKWLPDGLQTSRESIRTNLTLRNSLRTTREAVNLTLWAKTDPPKSGKSCLLGVFFC